MSPFFRTFVFIYFILFFLLLMVLRSIIVYKQTGRNPLVIPKDDTAYGLIGVYFKIMMGLVALFVIINFSFLNSMITYFLSRGWSISIYKMQAQDL